MQIFEPTMTPAPGERLQRFVGDRIRFELRDRKGRSPAAGWRACLRTNLGRAEVLRREIIQAHTRGLPLAGESWRDLGMKVQGEGWVLDLPLAEVGYFKAKAYLVDPRGWQHWPDGPDVGVSVHPDTYRTANTIYCAFTRLVGPDKRASVSSGDREERAIAVLDHEGYAVIPPSGKIRDVIGCLPHIIDTLGCRILHLLPVNPTPTTLARFGRFGSPYAALDLTLIDPALVVFDQRTTGVEQFRELTFATHARGGRVFLDIVINHTGWGSVLQETHPEWFLRQSDGRFASPGAWGVIWEDLVELKHQNVALWDVLAEMFLTWCRRGVDGFRCDAGYKVPLAAWQYIVARVQQEFPETLFLLEGLGGAWDTTEALLTDGGMQWAYSELFQNYSGQEVAGYLQHSLQQSGRVGLLIHYSETHDNTRLAARGRGWSLLRNRLCALASSSGGFGFTSGVEWLATERIKVHGCTGLNWGAKDNLIGEIARLNGLLAAHPCFFDGATIKRLSPEASPIYALHRKSAEGQDEVLVLVNTDVEKEQSLTLETAGMPFETKPNPGPGSGKQRNLSLSNGSNQASNSLSSWVDLLGQATPQIQSGPGTSVSLRLAPGAAFCLAAIPSARGLHGDAYRRARVQAAWAVTALSRILPIEDIGEFDWRDLAAAVDQSPAQFLASISQCAAERNASKGPVPWKLSDVLQGMANSFAQREQPAADTFPGNVFPRVVTWTQIDCRRVTLVPPDHWLLIQEAAPFRARLTSGKDVPENMESIPFRDGQVACFAPRQIAADADLRLERFTANDPHVRALVRFLSPLPEGADLTFSFPLHASRITHQLARSARSLASNSIVLLTNGRGAMARLCVDLGRVTSKYDCVLGANLHPNLPVDRHVFAKRIRVWVNADGFISPLDFRNLAALEPGPPAVWNFVANAGDGRTVEIEMRAEMLEGRNTTRFHFRRPTAAQASGKQLPADADVRLTVRLDIEDRNFHCETKRNGGAEHHFNTNTHLLPGSTAGSVLGFVFSPASERQLRVFCCQGTYHPQPEWSENIPHPVEQTRGQVGSGDAFSPGWFDLPLPKGANIPLSVTAELDDANLVQLEAAATKATSESALAQSNSSLTESESFARKLLHAARSFVVQRGAGKTVIAGYPWFLDWGRDTFICARGLLAAGMVDEVRQMLLIFARFEKNGTLPNTIFGEDASNRDTSDAPLWFAVVCEELAEHYRDSASGAAAQAFYETKLDGAGRTLRDVLESIAANYNHGTPNGIRMDPESALIWSPSHFTWMDTNYPAGTPRQGYPVEIQVLWIRLLRQLQHTGAHPHLKGGNALAVRAMASFERFFWREERGYYADVLLAQPGQPAANAVIDDALRSNSLLAISLGLATGERARRCVSAALRYLVVPGALRSLAPVPGSVPLPINGADGRLLNNPVEPYWGRYEGDEDTRRKPAYHNGTAWTWTFPVFCEALARAWDFSAPAVAAAKAYLGSTARLMTEGCLGQLPEIVDGDAPHTPRGCDAQAWGTTEALRVWKLLNERG
jgi:predicted glycogen debranching enzyme